MGYVPAAGFSSTEIFQVLQEAVERYEKEAPVFKKELFIGPDGSATEFGFLRKSTNICKCVAYPD